MKENRKELLEQYMQYWSLLPWLRPTELVKSSLSSSVCLSQLFSDVAYKARDREDLIAGIDEFLDEVIVLPPGEWDPKIRIEPPKKVTSADKRLEKCTWLTLLLFCGTVNLNQGLIANCFLHILPKMISQLQCEILPPCQQASAIHSGLKSLWNGTININECIHTFRIWFHLCRVYVFCRKSVFSLNELGQMNGTAGGGGGGGAGGLAEDEEMPVQHELGEELAFTGR